MTITMSMTNLIIVPTNLIGIVMKLDGLSAVGITTVRVRNRIAIIGPLVKIFIVRQKREKNQRRKRNRNKRIHIRAKIPRRARSQRHLEVKRVARRGTRTHVETTRKNALMLILPYTCRKTQIINVTFSRAHVSQQSRSVTMVPSSYLIPTKNAISQIVKSLYARLISFLAMNLHTSLSEIHTTTVNSLRVVNSHVLWISESVQMAQK
mmetsp:Transcript_33291/g.50213  ORF Transcript_33291/g.50213 Transcript_33291/m.50213 type:complete len:208 (-) Transcript_33291:1726-2349(-)